MKKNTLLVALLFALLISCQNKTRELASPSPAHAPKTEAPKSFAAIVESAHQKKAFLSHASIAFDIELFFGGKKRLDATVSMKTNSSKLRLDLADGTSLIYDGKQVYQHPSNVEYKPARFDIFTWPYFFAFPFKLTDPGTQWQSTNFNSLNNKNYLSEKLTFEAGTGDSSDDWYIAYANPETELLHAAAYIVTLGRSQAEGERDPHAIVYEEYQTVDAVPIATKWTFWGWQEEAGLTEQLGNAQLSNIHFIAEDGQLYEIPEDVKEIML